MSLTGVFCQAHFLNLAIREETYSNTQKYLEHCRAEE